METLDIIVSIINSVGFPIACVVVLFWLLYKEQKNHVEESDKWCDAFNNNSNVLKENSKALESLKKVIEVLVSKIS